TRADGVLERGRLRAVPARSRRAVAGLSLVLLRAVVAFVVLEEVQVVLADGDAVAVVVAALRLVVAEVGRRPQRHDLSGGDVVVTSQLGGTRRDALPPELR